MKIHTFLAYSFVVLLSGCASVSADRDAAELRRGSTVSDAATTHQLDKTTDFSTISLEQFSADALAEQPEIVDCTLTDGTATQCAHIVVKYKPDSLQIGPFCPANIHTDVGGFWDWDGENAGVYRLNEAFFLMLTRQGFDFYDAEGNTYIADPAGGIIDGVNNCLEAKPAREVVMTALIPLQPVKAVTPTQLGTVAQVGIGVDGVPIFADAPSVLDRGHLPALDVCGGHIDPGGWYHWHATATDIESSLDHEGIDIDCHLEQQPSSLFAYAFDGYPIYGSLDADGTRPDDLDECNGHVGHTMQTGDDHYHYHAGLEFPNLPRCLTGMSATNAFVTTAKTGIGAQGGPRNEGGQNGGGGRPDFNAAAAKLGINANELRSALGGPPPDFASAATKLGIPEDALREALGLPAQR